MRIPPPTSPPPWRSAASRSAGRSAFATTTPWACARSRRRRWASRTISDLKKHPSLRLGLSHAFLERDDGWRGLRAAYGLPFAKPAGMEHSIAYRGLVAGNLDVIDLYTTDAEIARYGLRVLNDDRQFLPGLRSRPALSCRSGAASPGRPSLYPAFARRLDEPTMQRLNGRVNTDGVREAVVAADFLGDHLGVNVEVEARNAYGDACCPRPATCATRLRLVGPGHRRRGTARCDRGASADLFGQVILGGVSVLQTVPALALLSCSSSCCDASAWCRRRRRCSSTVCCRSSATPTQG